MPDAVSKKTDQTDTAPALLGLLSSDTHNPVAFLELPLLNQDFPLWKILAHSASLPPTPPAEMKPSSEALPGLPHSGATPARLLDHCKVLMDLMGHADLL